MAFCGKQLTANYGLVILPGLILGGNIYEQRYKIFIEEKEHLAMS